MEKKCNEWENERHEMSSNEDRFYHHHFSNGIESIRQRHNLMKDNLIKGLEEVDDDTQVVTNYYLSFRDDDVKHRAAYHNILDSIGRIKVFRDKLRSMKKQLLEQLAMNVFAC